MIADRLWSLSLQLLHSEELIAGDSKIRVDAVEEKEQVRETIVFNFQSSVFSFQPSVFSLHLFHFLEPRFSKN